MKQGDPTFAGLAARLRAGTVTPADLDAAADAIDGCQRVDWLVQTLAWYGEQARLARLIHSEGDAGRHAIAADGGDKARDALSKLEKGAACPP